MNIVQYRRKILRRGILRFADHGVGPAAHFGFRTGGWFARFRTCTSGDGLLPGDVIQLGRGDGDFYHTLLVSGVTRRGYLVAAHSDDALDRPLSTYNFRRIRYLHIEGCRGDPRYAGACFDDLITGTSLGI